MNTVESVQLGTDEFFIALNIEVGFSSLSGSGRKEIEKEVQDRLNKEFPYKKIVVMSFPVSKKS